MRKILISFVLLGLLSGLVGFYLSSRLTAEVKNITSFESCVKAKFPILESYPPVCKTPDGRSFTQNIGNELKYHDEIIISTPRPNQKIASPLLITGKARGSWFFEGQFTAELVDTNNKSLGKTIIKATGEWMTNDFVFFSGQLVYVKGNAESAMLKIRSDNPSGLPENEKEIVMPVSL